MDRLYIHPLTTVSGPQAVGGDAVRLAGGMVYAREFALIVRRDGQTVSREVVTPAGIDAALARLPDELGPEGERQWSGLRTAHPPMQLGQRTVRLDQPQIAGILNVTPDSFSDGGAFLDDPEAGREQAALMLEAGAALVDICLLYTSPSPRD